ncbi:hypothetical protein C2S52_004534 [Perilla frutescens var. hirtella]|nr:hypothetical protein C2S52_004534 [Perilla frutescens var. hirtella]
MEPWVDYLADDLQSMSFNSTTTTTAIDIHRSTSSGSDWTSSSTYFPPSSTVKPHSSTTPSDDPCWDSIRLFPSLSHSDLRFLHRLGADDIGSVYLAELKPPSHPPIDQSRGGLLPPFSRRRSPFLPTLYAVVESPKWSCLLKEFYPGGDLHVPVGDLHVLLETTILLSFWTIFACFGGVRPN